MESSFFLSSGHLGDQCYSYSVKMRWMYPSGADVCPRMLLFWTTHYSGCRWSCRTVMKLYHLLKCNSVRMLSSAACLDVMIVEERRWFPYGRTRGLRLSKDLHTVVLGLIIQDDWLALVSVWGFVYIQEIRDMLGWTVAQWSAPKIDGITIIGRGFPCFKMSCSLIPSAV